MTAAVENMAYAGQVPWHGLGEKVQGLNPRQMMRAAKVDWTVSKRPLFMQVGGQMVEIDDQYWLGRDTDDQFLSIVGERWKAIQNKEIFEFFMEYCAAGDMTMETAGSLWNGRYIWVLAKVNGGFKIGREDEVADYVLIALPHVFGKSMILKWTGIRVVCWNTLSLALGRSIAGKQPNEFRLPHISSEEIVFNKSVQEQAKLTLKLATAQSKEFAEAAKFLAKRRATAEQVDAFFGTILHFDGSQQLTTASGKEKKPPKMLAMFQDALVRAPGADLATAEGTWWGAFNAVTYVVDHESLSRDADNRLRSAWMGPGADLKADALKVALQMAA